METLGNKKDYSKETALAQRVARIFGYEGLKIEVKEGAGWQTIRHDDSLTLVVDPNMLQPHTLKDATGKELDPETEIPEQYSIYGIAHELGHVDDYLQPIEELETIKARSKAEHIFWNILDDGVINNRLRNIPLLDKLTDEVYQDLLFTTDDYTHKPKHMQFMYGWLLGSVTPEREVAFSEDVAAAIESLKEIEIDGKKENLFELLPHPYTNLARRRELATKHILPIYEKFLEQDKQEKENEQSENSKGDGEGEKGDGDSDGGGEDTSEWDDIYDAYKDASHCGGHEHDDDENEEDSEDGGDDKSDDEQDPHDAIKEAGEILKEIQEEKVEAEKNETEQSSDSNTAGSIAEELNLSPEDAESYRQTVEQYRKQIHEVAKILEKLTVPSIEYISPRYKKGATTDGLKLSPRDLFRTAIAQHSQEDPAIWKPVETVAKREGYSFNGLDIHLLIDSSGSMHGVKAESAAACGVMLTEGLDLARRMVERYNPQSPKPDVRLQTILFGASAEVVVPLGHETRSEDKGIAFATIRNAMSGSTLVVEAIKKVADCANKNPERTQLVYVITDGDIYDISEAQEIIKKSVSNLFVSEYVLLSPNVSPLVQEVSHLDDPTELPYALNKQLKKLAKL